MAQGQPSRTAQGAAMLRAAHQLIDTPRVFEDALALNIIGAEAQAALRQNLARYAERASLRAYVALRSRYSEDQLALAVQRGVSQYVVLGAGLDTFAYRNPHAALRVFEVDHPATQRWKRQRLADAGIAPPRALTFAPVDFETQTLGAGLRAAGFDAARPAFFSMLGVAIYITQPALMSTLSQVAALAPGSEIVFSYAVHDALLNAQQRAARAQAASRVAALGEPWISYYDPAALEAQGAKLGFTQVATLTAQNANERYFKGRADGLRVSGSSRLLRARV
ncbi:MAG: class I SAM-dependent methyltransferase [Betaproteobacteria bacterium]|nr:class I SAM-dependent methyltransferase [Betaproteobacteria bacterium]